MHNPQAKPPKSTKIEATVIPDEGGQSSVRIPSPACQPHRQQPRGATLMPAELQHSGRTSHPFHRRPRTPTRCRCCCSAPSRPTRLAQASSPTLAALAATLARPLDDLLGCQQHVHGAALEGRRLLQHSLRLQVLQQPLQGAWGERFSEGQIHEQRSDAEPAAGSWADMCNTPALQDNSSASGCWPW